MIIKHTYAHRCAREQHSYLLRLPHIRQDSICTYVVEATLSKADNCDVLQPRAYLDTHS